MIIIIGCGTTGNQLIPLLQGEKLLIDRDVVEESNLSRQPLFSKEDIGKSKAAVLAKKNSCAYKFVDLDVSSIDLLKDAELVIDCCDNLATRFLINDYCLKHSIPWIYTGVVSDRGRVLAMSGEYCFSCFFSEVQGLDTCRTVGVDLAVAKQVAKIAVEEIARLLSGKKGRGLWANGDWIEVVRRSDCSVCHGEYRYLEGEQKSVIKFCGSSRYQFRGKFDYANVKKRLGGSGDWFVYEDFYIFQDRVLVKASSALEAKKKFASIIGC